MGFCRHRLVLRRIQPLHLLNRHADAYARAALLHITPPPARLAVRTSRNSFLYPLNIMTIAYPIAWLLLIPLILYWYFHRQPTLAANILRLCFCILAIAVMSGISFKWKDRNGILIAVVDQSKSMPENARQEIKNAIKRLDSRRPNDSRLGVISFSGTTAIEKMPDDSPFDDFNVFLRNPNATNLHDAVTEALKLIPLDTPARLLICSDGIWNGQNPQDAFAKAAAQSVPVDVKLYQRDHFNDLAIADIQAPFTAYPNETFAVSILISSPVNQNAIISVRRNQSQPANQKVALHRGLNQIVRRDQSATPGVIAYDIRLVAENGEMDDIPENNIGRRVVQVVGRKRMLLLSESPSRNLAKVLTAAQLPVDVAAPSSHLLSPEHLANYSGLILENIPASKLGMNGMELIAQLVKSGALGLFMTGGRSSFAVGGYYKSPLDEVLPVTMEQRQEIRKSTVAVVVVLDRSGSMAMSIDGGRTKMDLANLGTAEVFKLLAPTDLFSAIAVDSSPHIVIPLSPVSSHPNAQSSILGITSMGGGIFVYTGLAAAFEQIMKTDVPTRHIILFADAADAEEPDEYQNLLAQGRLGDITVSVIALGNETDSDADFLKDVARLGGGICYFTDNANELPRIFVEDTFAMVRNTFIDTATEGAFTPSVQTLSPANVFGQHVTLGGYNLCYAAPQADVQFITQDENKAPLAATRSVQLGRTAAFMGEADGKYTGPFGNHPAAAPLLTALANWILPPEDESEDYLVSQSLANGILTITIDLLPERERDPFADLPVFNAVIQNANGENTASAIRFQWNGPDQVAARLPLEGDSVCLGTISWTGLKSPIAIAPAMLPVSPEFAPSASDNDLSLTELAAITGGRERIVLDDIWKELPAKHRFFDMTPLLAIFAMLCLLLSKLPFFIRRQYPAVAKSSVQRPVQQSAQPTVSAKSKRPKTTAQPSQPETPTPPTPSTPEPPPESTDSISDALKRVRKR
ncbi:MAG: VWA domain-containing protein [Victivallales bacterium]|nr:VWA domain-containing protein [Victivallales bacterium]